MTSHLLLHQILFSKMLSCKQWCSLLLLTIGWTYNRLLKYFYNYNKLLLEIYLKHQINFAAAWQLPLEFITSGAWSTLRGRLIKAKPALQFLLGRISVLDSFSCLLRFSLNIIRWFQKFYFQNLGPLLRFCRSLQRVLDQGDGRRHRHHDPKCVHVSRLYRLQSTTSWR